MTPCHGIFAGRCPNRSLVRILFRELSRGTKICQRTDLKSKDLEANGAFWSDRESCDKLQGRSLVVMRSLKQFG